MLPLITEDAVFMLDVFCQVDSLGSQIPTLHAREAIAHEARLSIRPMPEDEVSFERAWTIFRVDLQEICCNFLENLGLPVPEDWWPDAIDKYSKASIHFSNLNTTGIDFFNTQRLMRVLFLVNTDPEDSATYSGLRLDFMVSKVQTFEVTEQIKLEPSADHLHSAREAEAPNAKIWGDKYPHGEINLELPKGICAPFLPGRACQVYFTPEP